MTSPPLRVPSARQTFKATLFSCPCRVRWRAGHGSLRIAVSVPAGAGAESGRFDG